jgi:hypothetical protein
MGGIQHFKFVPKKFTNQNEQNFIFGAINNPVILQTDRSSGLHPFEIPECATVHSA